MDNKYSLLDWSNHVRALSAKWILNYLDEATGPWKQVLDQWLARTRLGRRAALFAYPTEILDGPLQEQDESYLPLFWDEALQDIRALRLSRLSNTRAGASYPSQSATTIIYN